MNTTITLTEESLENIIARAVAQAVAQVNQANRAPEKAPEKAPQASWVRDWVGSRQDLELVSDKGPKCALVTMRKGVKRGPRRAAKAEIRANGGWFSRRRTEDGRPLYYVYLDPEKAQEKAAELAERDRRREEEKAAQRAEMNQASRAAADASRIQVGAVRDALVAVSEDHDGAEGGMSDQEIAAWFAAQVA